MKENDEIRPLCWNCGGDYLLKGWEESSLIAMKIYGQDDFICLECIDTLPEDAGGGK